MSNSNLPILKDKYVRRVIKLGNSYAMTFPQDWATQSELKEKTEIFLFPLDEKTLVIKSQEKKGENDGKVGLSQRTTAFLDRVCESLGLSKLTANSETGGRHRGESL